MIRILIVWAMGLLLLGLQSVFLRYAGWELVRIDFTVAMVAYLALRSATIEGALGAFGLGYLLDLMSGRPTGLYTFLGVLLFLLGRLASSLVDVGSMLMFALFVAGMEAGHWLLSALMELLVGGRAFAGGAGFAAAMAQIVLTALAAAALYPALERLGFGDVKARPDLLR